MNLIDEKLRFTRGKHSGETLWEVAEDDIKYLLWLVEDSKISESDREVLENWLLQHPDYCDRVEL